MALFFGAGLALFPAGTARADSLLHAYGDAANKEYREMRALGPSPTVSQINQVRHDSYDSLIDRAVQEGAQMWRNESHKLGDALVGLRAAAFPSIYKDKKHPWISSAPGDASPAVNDNNKGGGNGAIPSAIQNRGDGTGQGGSDGAKDVGFQTKKKDKPIKVDDDGIIQDR